MKNGTISQGNRIPIALSLILALLFSGLAILVSAPLAHAGGGSPGGGGVGSGGNPGWESGGRDNSGNIGGSKGPGKGPGKGTGAGTPGSPGNGTKPGNGSYGQGWQYYSATLYVTAGNTMPGCSLNDLGDGAIGATSNYKWSTSNDGVALGITGSTVRGLINSGQINVAKKYFASSSIKCIYPARWVIQNSKYKCVIDSTAEIVQNAPRSRTLGTAGMTSDWGRGVRTIEACQNSATDVYISGGSPEYGRYSAAARTRVQFANIKHYTTADPRTGAVPADEIHSVGAISTINPAAARWQSTCAGFSEGWSGNFAFNQTECGPNQNQHPQLYQCTIDGDANPLVNGTRTNNATIFRDGEMNTIAWSRPSITGTANGVPEGKTQIIRSGTPWNTTSKFPTAKTNDVELYRDGKSKFTKLDGTGWMNKTMSDGWGLKAYWASDTGKPTLLTPQYKWMADWVISTRTVTSINPLTGAITTAPITQTVSAEALCTGTPLTVNIVRATTGTGK
jgi:hypothetical protein